MLSIQTTLIQSFQSSLTSPPIQELRESWFADYSIQLFILRLDLLHPTVKGNKWYKLSENLRLAAQQGYQQLLTFGGAFSNHIYATAAAGQLFNFKTIGVIRGEEHLPLNPILAFAQEAGMKLIYLDRQTYRLKNTPQVLDQLHQTFGSFYLIPEGGANLAGIHGSTQIVPSQPFDYLCCASGTGGTLAGLIAGTDLNTIKLGFSVLKGGEFLRQEIQSYLLNYQHHYATPPLDTQGQSWRLITDYHFGGYAKTKPELLAFIKDFRARHSIPIEPVYTGKLFYGIYQEIQQGTFKPHTRILAIHTGGVY